MKKERHKTQHNNPQQHYFERKPTLHKEDLMSTTLTLINNINRGYINKRKWKL